MSQLSIDQCSNFPLTNTTLNFLTFELLTFELLLYLVTLTFILVTLHFFRSLLLQKLYFCLNACDDNKEDDRYRKGN